MATTDAQQDRDSPPTGDAPRFDVFLSHNSRDKPAVERLATKLKHAGLEPWLDKWCLTPGGRWQDELAAGLRSCAACAVFVGPHGLGDWVREELGIALDRAAKDRSFRLFLVLLPGLPEPFDPNTLPPFLSTRTWVDLRPGIDEPRAFQHLVSAIKGVPFGQPVALPPSEDVCPYRGLQTFDEEHAEFFFGRANDVQRLVEKLKATRFLAVLGPSGSGKSSLVRAGLIPALHRGALPGSSTWTTCVFTPGAHPLTMLAAQLLRQYGQDTMHRTLDALGADARTLHLAVALALAEQPAGERMVWVIDQFEEVFTLCQDEHERSQFLANLLYAASIPEGRCVVVLTLRADFYPRCAAYPDFSARIAAQQFLVSPMDLEGLRQAIEEPAWRVGLEFEEGLVPTILDDVAHQPGALPLLEHALLELWERRRAGLLTLEGYRESGGVQGAISKRAEAIFSALTAEQQAIAQRTLLRLTQPGEGTEDTRRRAALDELVTRSGSGADVEGVVNALVEARLLTTSEDAPAHEQVVEVSHEALIRGWPRLRQWIEEDRSGLREHRRLTEAAQEWQRLGRDEGALYRGARLATALEWREHHDADLNDLERAFLDAGAALQRREEEEEQERQRRELAAARALADAERKRARVARLLSLGLSALALVVVVALVAGFYALQQGSAAQTASRVADSGRLAANAVAQLQVDPELSILLATEAVRKWHTVEAVDALREALAESHVRATLRGHSGAIYNAAFSRDGRWVVTASADRTARVWDAHTGRLIAILRGHTGAVLTAAFSPDGKRVVTGSLDATARLWDAQSGRPIAVLRGHTGGVGARFSPDGTRIVTVSADRTARLWDARTGRPIAILRGHSGIVWDASFSPDGRTVATASADGTARLWDARTGRPIAVLRGHSGQVLRVAFSPDGRWLVTASGDKTARVWDAHTGHLVSVLSGHDSTVWDAAFSPDGRRVVTASADGRAAVWDAQQGTEAFGLVGHTTDVYSAAFSPDGRYVATASGDGTARLWNASLGLPLIVLHGHTDQVVRAAFSPDGAAVLTASLDRTARVWDAGTGRVVATTPERQNWFFSATFSPDGRWLAAAGGIITGGGDDVARVWDVHTGRLAAVLRGHQGVVQDVAFSRDGRYVATASWDGTARLWQAGTWHGVAVLRGSRAPMTSVAFSPDGRRFVTGGGDDVARVWDVHTGRLLATLRGPKAAVSSVAFSPDGRYVVAGFENGTARVWQAGAWRGVAVLGQTGSPIMHVAISPDGRWLAAGRKDGTARVWAVGTWRSVATLSGHTAAVLGVSFSRDGKWLVTGSGDYTARVWEVDTWRSMAVLYGHQDLVLSAGFSPDGRWVLTAGADGTARLHPCDVCGSADDLLALARTRVTRQLTPAERATYLR